MEYVGRSFIYNGVAIGLLESAEWRFLNEEKLGLEAAMMLLLQDQFPGL